LIGYNLLKEGRNDIPKKVKVYGFEIATTHSNQGRV